MGLEEADRIRLEWGKFLEHVNPVLMKIFHTDIPELALPCTEQQLLEAISVIKREGGSAELVQVLEGTLPILMAYTENGTALKRASEKFSDNNYVNAIAKSSHKS